MRWSLPTGWKLILVLTLLLSGAGSTLISITAQAGGWQVGQIVGLPKTQLIRTGPGFASPVHTCVPEDNWLVLVTGGPRTVNGIVWYDTSREALDQLPTSGTGWVAFDPSADLYDPLVNTNVNCSVDNNGGGQGGDGIPPIISEIEVWSDGEGNLLVSALITDNVAVAGATLITNLGSFPMLPGEDGRYYAIVTGLRSGSTLTFSIWSADTSGNDASAGPQQVKIRLTGQSGILPWTTAVSEPITLPLGNFVTLHSDLHVAGINLAFDFTRTYNAMNAFDGPFGFGWTHTYNWQLENVDNPLFHGVRITYPDGHTAKYAGSGDQFTPPPGHYDHLEHSANGFSLSSPDRTRYDFDLEGHLVRQQDRSGNALTFQYTDDRLTTITDTAGRSYTLAYDGQGQIISLTEGLGRVVSYSYTAVGDLERVSLPDSGNLVYIYDGEHRLLSITDPNGRVFVTNTYDDRDRVIEQRDAAGSVTLLTYSDDDSQATLKDNENNTTTYAFDTKFRLTQETDALGYSVKYVYDDNHNPIQITDRGGHVTKASYDTWGNVISIDDGSGHLTELRFENGRDLVFFKDAVGAEWQAVYNDIGNLTTLTTPLGTSHYVYNSRGQVEKITDPANSITLFSYDAVGNLATITDAQQHKTQFMYDGIGRLAQITDAKQHITKFVYNGADRLVEVIDPQGASTHFAYNSVGNLMQMQDRVGATTLFAYTANDQLEKVTDPLGYVSSFTYDDMYHLTSVTDQRGGTTRLEYDKVYNLVRVYDQADKLTQYEYDADRDLITIIDGLSSKTQFKRDAFHRVTQIIDALSQMTDITYNAVGAPISIKDAREGITTYIYNGVGQTTSITDALQGITSFQYDSRGNLIDVEDALHHHTHYIYDELNQLTKIVDALNQTQILSYDAVGNLEYLTDKRGKVAGFVYDKNDNLIQITDTGGGKTLYAYDKEDRLTGLTNPNGNTTTYDYDIRGDMIQVQLPEGQTTHLTYDANRNLETVTNASDNTIWLAYNSRDLLMTSTDPLQNVTTYGYDALGQLTSIIDAEQRETQYGYDALGRLTRVTQNAVAGQPINNPNVPDQNVQTLYTYDPLGALLSITDAKGHLQSFEVDKLGRITDEHNALSHTWHYAYDALGNLTERTDANGDTTVYSYDELNRLIKTTYDDGKSVTYGFDPNDNLTSMVDASGQTNIGYDDLNRLVAMTKSSQGVVEQTMRRAFDRASNLISMMYPDGRKETFDYNDNEWLTYTHTPNSGVTSYTYNPDGLLREINFPNQTSTKRTYDAADQLVSLESRGPGGVFSAFSYRYDKVGNRLQTIETLLGPDRPANTGGVASVPTVATTPLIAASYTPVAFTSTATQTSTTTPSKTATYTCLEAAGNSRKSHKDCLVETFTATSTSTATSTLTSTFTSVIVPSATLIDTTETATATATNTPALDSIIATAVPTDTSTTTATPTETAAPEVVVVPSSTSTLTETATATLTVVPTSTLALPDTATVTLTSTLTETSALTATLTSSPTATLTATVTPSPTSTPTATLTPTSTPIYISVPECPSFGDLPLTSTPPTLNDLLVTLEVMYTYCLIDNQGTFNGLHQKLDAALADWQMGQLSTASNHLNAFIAEVTAQSGQHIDSQAALLLSQMVQQVIENFSTGVNRADPPRTNKGGRPTHTRTIDYTYDALYRLESAQYSTGEMFAYSYDLVGNILSEQTNWNMPHGNGFLPPVLRQFTYNEANQLITAGDLSFIYDLNGNRTRLSGSDRIIDYAYDIENQLIGAQAYNVRPGNTIQDDTVDFTYDGLGRLWLNGVSDQGVTKTTRYVYSDFSFDAAVEMSTPGQTTYYYGDPLGQRLQMQEIQGNGKGLNTFFAPDGVGSTSAITDHQGHEIKVYSYAPFGLLADNNGAENASNKTDPHNHYTFNDTVWDENLQLDYFGARFYDPTTLNWLTPDLYRGTIADPGSLHRYGFVKNNPTTLADFGGFFDVTTGQVQAGDTLWSIAQQVYGTGSHWQGIYAQNRSRISNPNMLQAGMTLDIAGLRSAQGYGSAVTSQTVSNGVAHNPMSKSSNGGRYPNSAYSTNHSIVKSSVSTGFLSKDTITMLDIQKMSNSTIGPATGIYSADSSFPVSTLLQELILYFLPPIKISSVLDALLDIPPTQITSLKIGDAIGLWSLGNDVRNLNQDGILPGYYSVDPSMNFWETNGLDAGTYIRYGATQAKDALIEAGRITVRQSQRLWTASVAGLSEAAAALAPIVTVPILPPVPIFIWPECFSRGGLNFPGACNQTEQIQA